MEDQVKSGTGAGAEGAAEAKGW
ncbi:MAG: hypothetical protein QOI12_1788, partial [Alphaproteobacteria bacterium]|nr:hypothetical protein [Alphaproteobacteria bacterium]